MRVSFTYTVNRWLSSCIVRRGFAGFLLRGYCLEEVFIFVITCLKSLPILSNIMVTRLRKAQVRLFVIPCGLFRCYR